MLALYLILGACGVTIAWSVFMICRVEWVYQVRGGVLHDPSTSVRQNLDRYDRLPSFDAMVRRFWVLGREGLPSMTRLRAILNALGWSLGVGPDVPVSSAASALSKEGHRQRKAVVESKRIRVHTELEAYVAAKRSERAAA